MEIKNKECKSHRDVIMEVVKRTEFKEEDVRFIVNEYIDEIIDEIKNDVECVRIGRLGKVYTENSRKYGKIVKIKLYRKTKEIMLGKTKTKEL